MAMEFLFVVFVASLSKSPFADHSLCGSRPAVYFVPTEYHQPNSAEKMEEYRKNMEKGEKPELGQIKQYVDPMNMKLSCKEIQQVLPDAVIEKLMLDPILFRFRYGNRLPFYGHRYLGVLSRSLYDRAGKSCWECPF
ncbi:hypothetical protein DAPPUDRAFT_101359 [Daphnia pulex]|uniref:Uncharacterized protein n=1 Tax=Daphnia pulex TaxID=6669 RepID=E9GD50_DAPPU|nr:hypothetical protein DAPPUDRAFT_101359 [Daphnia pulex]|eukprot:EFX82755.1 hypothetical protein DAPPUDRAFT_101359 [Daphnia pulex]